MSDKITQQIDEQALKEKVRAEKENRKISQSKLAK